ncbi:MAG: DUF2232 domain-containing protein [Bdellovibrionales bacterium]|nr:DUF2232 domain-containing protein [Bdellovibrionales bacterium]
MIEERRGAPDPERPEGERTKREPKAGPGPAIPSEVPGAEGNLGEGFTFRFPAGVRVPLWVRAIPFVISALLYMSAVFAVFAPLPLLLLYLRASVRWQLAAVASNTALVALLGGPAAAGLFLAIVGVTAVVLPHALRYSPARPDRAIAWTASSSLLSLVAGGLASWGLLGAQPLKTLQASAQIVVDRLREMSGESASNWNVPPEEIIRSLLVELPSGATITILLLVTANCFLFLRANPVGLRQKFGISENYFRIWKAPDYLVWVAIGSAFTLLTDLGIVSDIGINVFKVSMALYGLHGLAVLSSAFEAWRIQGLVRSALYALVVTMGVPLLLALGFFDLWFDFRSKLRQS